LPLQIYLLLSNVGGNMKISRVLFFAGLGAALMYLFDPQHGENRRTQLRDQVVTLRDTLEGELDTRVPQVADKARSLAQDARQYAAKLEEDLESTAELDRPKTPRTRKASQS
jgi:hypothetical protein